MSKISLLIAVSLLLVSSYPVHGFSITSNTGGVAKISYQPTNFGCGIPQSTTSLHAKQTKNKSDNEDKSESNSGIMGTFKKSPGTLIIAPFVLLFGLDLILNIAVVTKRSLEVFFTGEYTVWTPWQ